MVNLDFEQIELRQIVTHFVGNKMREEEVILSKSGTDVDSETSPYLLKYLLQSFKPHEFYQFSHTVELEMNEIFSLVKKLFAERDTFIENSQHVAKLLYEKSAHPKIKAGELNVVYFDGVVLGDEVVNAVGIFKSESNSPFLKMSGSDQNFRIKHDFGYEIKGMDKGCLVFNTDEENGYEVLVVDTKNRSQDAQFWKDEFLKLKPRSSEFHETKQFLTLTKNYVTEQLHEDFEVEKADKIDLLNRSMDFFKSNETFEREEFEKDVLQDENMINSFRKFDDTYRQERELPPAPAKFDISVPAVKKQARTFKSVLKLDKNFHVYIHGDRELIEKGEDGNGKFYKIYFENEE